jgi:hypothetical protein
MFTLHHLDCPRCRKTDSSCRLIDDSIPSCRFRVLFVEGFSPRQLRSGHGPPPDRRDGGRLFRGGKVVSFTLGP